MLTVLRTPDEGPAPMEPAATLADLPAIIERAERGGLLIETELEGIGPDAEGAGSFDALEQGIELTVCTVVAEGLTNVLRHAGPTTVRLRVARSAHVVAVDVIDDGPAPSWRPAPGAGHGLTGLRERLRAYGGTLNTQLTSPGFRLQARLPLGAGA